MGQTQSLGGSDDVDASTPAEPFDWEIHLKDAKTDEDKAKVMRYLRARKEEIRSEPDRLGGDRRLQAEWVALVSQLDKHCRRLSMELLDEAALPAAGGELNLVMEPASGAASASMAEGEEESGESGGDMITPAQRAEHRKRMLPPVPPQAADETPAPEQVLPPVLHGAQGTLEEPKSQRMADEKPAHHHVLPPVPHDAQAASEEPAPPLEESLLLDGSRTATPGDGDGQPAAHVLRRVADLEKRLAMAHAERRQSTATTERLTKEVADARRKHSEGEVQMAVVTKERLAVVEERDELRVQVETLEARVKELSAGPPGLAVGLRPSASAKMAYQLGIADGSSSAGNSQAASARAVLSVACERARTALESGILALLEVHAQRNVVKCVVDAIATSTATEHDGIGEGAGEETMKESDGGPSLETLCGVREAELIEPTGRSDELGVAVVAVVAEPPSEGLVLQSEEVNEDLISHLEARAEQEEAALAKKQMEEAAEKPTTAATGSSAAVSEDIAIVLRTSEAIMGGDLADGDEETVEEDEVAVAFATAGDGKVADAQEETKSVEFAAPDLSVDDEADGEEAVTEVGCLVEALKDYVVPRKSGAVDECDDLNLTRGCFYRILEDKDEEGFFFGLAETGPNAGTEGYIAAEFVRRRSSVTDADISRTRADDKLEKAIDDAESAKGADGDGWRHFVEPDHEEAKALTLKGSSEKIQKLAAVATSVIGTNADEKRDFESVLQRAMDGDDTLTILNLSNTQRIFDAMCKAELDATLAHIINIVQATVSLEALELCNIGLTDHFAIDLANALKENDSISKVVLDTNDIRGPGFSALASMLIVNRSLRRLSACHQRMKVPTAVQHELVDSIKANGHITTCSIDFHDATARDNAGKALLKNADNIRLARIAARDATSGADDGKTLAFGSERAVADKPQMAEKPTAAIKPAAPGKPTHSQKPTPAEKPTLIDSTLTAVAGAAKGMGTLLRRGMMLDSGRADALSGAKTHEEIHEGAHEETPSPTPSPEPMYGNDDDERARKAQAQIEKLREAKRLRELEKRRREEEDHRRKNRAAAEEEVFDETHEEECSPEPSVDPSPSPSPTAKDVEQTPRALNQLEKLREAKKLRELQKKELLQQQMQEAVQKVEKSPPAVVPQAGTPAEPRAQSQLEKLREAKRLRESAKKLQQSGGVVDTVEAPSPTSAAQAEAPAQGASGVSNFKRRPSTKDRLALWEKKVGSTDNPDDNPDTKPKRSGSVKRHSFLGAGEGERCVKCDERVYVAEKVSVDGQVYHKACFRCSVDGCKKKLSPGTYAAMQGTLYCKPCFKKMFKLKGNYDEGFGKEQHKMKWQRNSMHADSEA